MFRSEASLLFDRPPPSLNAVELGRHSGMDRRTNRQDSRFARLRRPKGEGHGCPSCIQVAGTPSNPVPSMEPRFRRSMPE